jgi:hypothetical protein
MGRFGEMYAKRCFVPQHDTGKERRAKRTKGRMGDGATHLPQIASSREGRPETQRQGEGAIWRNVCEEMLRSSA